jgi:hypothetical protein
MAHPVCPSICVPNVGWCVLAQAIGSIVLALAGLNLIAATILRPKTVCLNFRNPKETPTSLQGFQSLCCDGHALQLTQCMVSPRQCMGMRTHFGCCTPIVVHNSLAPLDSSILPVII